MTSAVSAALLVRSGMLRISHDVVCSTAADGPENIFVCAVASSCVNRVMIPYMSLGISELVSLLLHGTVLGRVVLLWTFTPLYTLATHPELTILNLQS
jgi:hypothetical protein